MNRILDLYSEILAHHKAGARFVDEVFYDDIYGEVFPKLTIIDLGAFEGEFSFKCLPIAKKIYAVEPEPRPFEEMEKLVKEFELEDKISIFEIAIGGENGTRNMTFTGYGGNAFSGNEPGPVETKTLATFMKDNEIDHVDILKIDVESAEVEIFKAKDFIYAANRIDTIVGEAHNGVDEMSKLLEPHGFNVRPTKSSNVFIAKK